MQLDIRTGEGVCYGYVVKWAEGFLLPKKGRLPKPLGMDPAAEVPLFPLINKKGMTHPKLNHMYVANEGCLQVAKNST